MLFVFVASGFVSYLNTRTLNEDARQVTHTHEVLWALSDLLSLIKDAETGQRGYLITGDDRYLEPYTAAVAHIDQRMSDIERLIRDNPDQQGRIPALQGARSPPSCASSRRPSRCAEPRGSRPRGRWW